MTEQNNNLNRWQRVLFVAIFWVVFYITQLVVGLIAVAQCVFLLVTEKPNEQLRTLGDSMGKYVHDILRYVTFNSDQRPFPFTDFPKPDLIIPANHSTS
ncbi:MAG: DUF4389 domain-containing protein [Arenicella sp.]|nr:DUF4389 domain-containing protein [Arenicella sp.]